MKYKIRLIISIAFACAAMGAYAQKSSDSLYHEPFRPQLHFSPLRHWTNDPNGMVKFNGVYHLFFQYYPKATVWGPMHWGHAVSRDLVHWKELPIALYPDSLGYIFSGSAVVDSGNTSGFGRNGKIPLVAIFTQHDPVGAKEGKNNFQNQSIAYSLDGGYTWTKYGRNPVLKNPGITDFRDPKVRWYAPAKKWIMTLATKDRITFYSSPDLKHWTRESDFGNNLGAHGGVWECPDLFPMQLNGKKHWVLIVNVNPGGPNGGSATQYFIGRFDGHQFTCRDTTTKWIDYGPDEYAGITWSNAGSRHIFLGWMSNWEYATEVPTVQWRNAMTIPRELKLAESGRHIIVQSLPVHELSRLDAKTYKPVVLNQGKELVVTNMPGQSLVKLEDMPVKDCSFVFSNNAGEKLIIGFDSKTNRYYIDRTHSGLVNFNKDFAGVFYAPRMSASHIINMTLVMDASSAELFADNGSTVMTCIFFPKKPLKELKLTSASQIKASDFKCIALKSVW